jgi:signal transduction histidine kinase/CheY-like chemotaxis protein
LSLLTIWVPAYGAEAIETSITAIVSLVTAVTCWRMLPQALALPSTGQLNAAHEALRVAEEKLHQSHKMQAIGQLTGGIAHDFNNALMGVTLNLELIRRAMAAGRTDIERMVAGAEAGLWRAARLTRQLLSFARCQHLNPAPLDPAEVLAGMHDLLTRCAGERIALRIDIAPQSGQCIADRSQLESALLNLVLNARDAIAGEGAITIAVGREELPNSGDDEPPPGLYLRIAVADTGSGMTPEVMRRAFEPFFTTKRAGHGTGLGLSQIHGFAHQSGGTVRLHSEPGRGTEVAILLPHRDSPAAPVLPAPPRPAARPPGGGGEGTIVLVAEDDAQLRDATARVLADQGFEVIEAANGVTGLALLAREPNVAALLTDMSMPGPLDGVQLAELARQRRPGLPVILMTGFPGDLSQRTLPEGMDVLFKPCEPGELVGALRRRLASRDRAAGAAAGACGGAS